LRGQAKRSKHETDKDEYLLAGSAAGREPPASQAFARPTSADIF
jgi:hypothetical protein